MLRVTSYNPVTPVHIVTAVNEKSVSQEAQSIQRKADSINFSEESKKTSSTFSSSIPTNGISLVPKKESIDSITSQAAIEKQREIADNKSNEPSPSEKKQLVETSSINNAKKSSRYESSENTQTLGSIVNLII